MHPLILKIVLTLTCLVAPALLGTGDRAVAGVITISTLEVGGDGISLGLEPKSDSFCVSFEREAVDLICCSNFETSEQESQGQNPLNRFLDVSSVVRIYQDEQKNQRCQHPKNCRTEVAICLSNVSFSKNHSFQKHEFWFDSILDLFDGPPPKLV